FRQLFGFIFSQRDAADLRVLADIAREQNFSFERLRAKCIDVSKAFDFGGATPRNICWDSYTDQKVQEFGLTLGNSDVWALRRTYAAFSQQMIFISSSIAGLLKSGPDAKAGQSGTAKKLTDLHLIQADLSGVNFSGMDISGSYFDVVALDG